MKVYRTPISACIPAYNEGASLAAIMKPTSGQVGVYIDEVLVCANGCTDGTVGGRPARPWRRYRAPKPVRIVLNVLIATTKSIHREKCFT